MYLWHHIVIIPASNGNRPIATNLVEKTSSQCHTLVSGHSINITNMFYHLQWPTLEYWRKTACLILLFKIMKNLLTVPDRCLPIKTPVEFTRAHHSFKLAHLQCRLDLGLDIYKYSFLPRSIVSWNSLNIRNLDTMTLEDFKDCLISVL